MRFLSQIYIQAAGKATIAYRQRSRVLELVCACACHLLESSKYAGRCTPQMIVLVFFGHTSAMDNLYSCDS